MDCENCTYCEEALTDNQGAAEVYSDGRWIGYAHDRCLELRQYQEGAPSCCDYGCRGPCRSGGARGEEAV